MLPIDHLPFPAPDVDALAAAFERLGFRVTPPAAYRSPEGGEWRNRAVIFERGWFDLLREPLAPAGSAAPFACLFLTHDLEAATAALGDVQSSEVFRLERRFEAAERTEAFRYRNIRARAAPLFLSVVEHAWPCADLDPAWQAHPNGAVAIAGLIFGGAEPGPRAGAVGEVVDLSGFRYLPAEVFAARYGTPRQPVAVQVAVRSLADAAAALSANGVPFEAGESLVLKAPEGFGCSFEFVATGA